ncbi:hypothetical protein F4677DRAFT_427119 [Hypoxylon crocopeplum]|nr:hypothetical protein F4677DRAFT_427119 [Hypoxylon crocopeplum]
MGKKWTPIEDTVLRNEVELFKEDETVSWTQIARNLSDRSNKDCRKRWHKIHGQRHRGTWSKAEDTKLMQAVERHGARWTAVSDVVGTRTPDQCHKRWRNALNPSLGKSTWTQADDDCLLAAVMLHGRNWSSISREYFPARSPLELSNKYASLSQTQRQQASKGTMLQPLEECYPDYAQSLLASQLGNRVSSNSNTYSKHVSIVEPTPDYGQVYTLVSCQDMPTTINNPPYTDLGYFTNAASGVSPQSRESMNDTTQSTGTDTTGFPSGFIPGPVLRDHPVTTPSDSVINSFALDSSSALNDIQALVETDFEMPYFSLSGPGHSNQQDTISSILQSDSTVSETRTSWSMPQYKFNSRQSIQEQTDRRSNVAQEHYRPIYVQASGSAERGRGLGATRRTANNTSPNENVTLVLENVDPETREKVLQLMYQKKGSSLLRVSLEQ